MMRRRVTANQLCNFLYQEGNIHVHCQYGHTYYNRHYHCSTYNREHRVAQRRLFSRDRDSTFLAIVILVFLVGQKGNSTPVTGQAVFNAVTNQGWVTLMWK